MPTADDLVKRGDIMFVPASKLKVMDGFNLPGREEEGIDELADSLYKNGAKYPLKGYKDGEFYVVVAGHRRTAAAAIVKKKYKKTIIFPFICMPKGTTEADMLFEHFLSNDGLPLTPLQSAFGVKKLIVAGVKVKEIANKLCFSEAYVGNLRLLADAPAAAHDLIKKGIISSTLLISELKKKTDISQWIKRITESAPLDEEEGEETGGGNSKSKKKKAKVTKKNLGPNSVKEMKLFIKKGGGDGILPKRKELFAFVSDLLDNKYDYADLVKHFCG